MWRTAPGRELKTGQSMKTRRIFAGFFLSACIACVARAHAASAATGAEEARNKNGQDIYRETPKRGGLDTNCLLGLLFDQGIGVPQNYEEALKWYRLAANAEGQTREPHASAKDAKFADAAKPETLDVGPYGTCAQRRAAIDLAA